MIAVTTGGHWPDEVRRILAEVPEWFGLPESNDEYVTKARTYTNVVARDDTGNVVGICLLLHHNPRSTEIDLIAVPASKHRMGIGRAILEHVERDLRASGVKLLHLKTFGPSVDNEPYERTRRFYEGTGFIAMEERTDIWGPDNPCLMFVKPLLRGEADG